MRFVESFYFLLLGTVFVPTKFVNCQVPTKVYTSYQPGPHCKPSDYMIYPRSSYDVVGIVKQALRNGKKVKAIGSRHSLTDIICTDGTPVDMRKIKFAKMNEDDTATFGAGIKMSKIGKFLYGFGRALRVTPSCGEITLGGAIATASHGSSLKYPSAISEQVIRMTIVDGLGVKRVISDPEDLKSVGANLGLLGIIVDVTLATVPLYKILARSYVVSDDIFTNGKAIKLVKKKDQISFHWYPAFRQVVVMESKFVSTSKHGRAVSSGSVLSTSGYFNEIFSRAKEIAYELGSSGCAPASALGNRIAHVLELVTMSALMEKNLGIAPIYTENGLTVKNPAVGYAHSMQTASCSEKNSGLLGRACVWAHGDRSANITFVENEIAIPLEDLAGFIKTTKDIAKKTPTSFPMKGVQIQFSRKSNIYMSPAYQRDTAYIKFALLKREDPLRKAPAGQAGYQTVLQTLVNNFNGRSHWGKTGAAFHTKEMIKDRLDADAYEKFNAARVKFDPKGIFLNNFGLRLIQNGTKRDTDPKTIHCAILDNCICKRNADCAPSQECTKVPGYDFLVCKTRNEVPEVQFKKNFFRSINLLNWLSTTLPTLLGALKGVCEIPSVAFDVLPTVLKNINKPFFNSHERCEWSWRKNGNFGPEGSTILQRIIVDITFSPVPLYKILAHNHIVSDDILTNGDAVNFQNAFEIVTISALTKNTLGVAPIYTEDGKSCENPAVGYAHSMLATGCSEKDAGFFGRACIWAHGDLKSNVTVVDNEMAIALDDLTAFVLATKDIVKKTPTHFPLQGLRRFNGRTHWGKTGAAYHSAEMIKLKLDKNALENFTAAMRKFDPNQLFLNNFGSRLTQTGTKMDLDPKIIHCALLDNCFCSKDGDCGTTQTCTNLPGYNFTVCKTRNELPAVQFKKSLFGSNYFLNWLSTTLASLIASLRGTVFVPTKFVNCNGRTKVYSSYRPSPYCDPSDYMRYPKNADEVVAIVKEAIASGKKVKAFGSRHSQTDIICTDGIPVDMSKLKYFKMNSDNTVTVGSGMLLGEVGPLLRKLGRALKVAAAYKGITMGGAIGTGAHGSSIKFSSLISQQVVSLNIVNGLGKKMKISDPKDLQSFRVHLGLLGIIVHVTLSTVPLYKIHAHNYVADDDLLMNGDAVRWAKKADQITFCWFPTFEKVVVGNMTFVSPDTPGDASSNAIVPSLTSEMNFVVSRAKELVYDLTSSKCATASALGNSAARVFEIIAMSSLYKQTLGVAPIYTEDGKTVKNPAVGFADSMLSTSCNEGKAGFFETACIWAHGETKSNITILDNEIVIPLKRLPDFVKAVKDIVKKTPTTFPLQGMWIRFSGKSDIFMSTNYGRDSVHIEFIVMHRKKAYEEASGGLAGVQTILQNAVKQFKGRSHWGKTGAAYHTTEMINLMVDSDAREQFVAAMAKYDPKQIFLNKFGRRLMQNDTEMDLDPKITHCALLDNCFCSRHNDCAKTQECTTISGYNYPVCKTINEILDVKLGRINFPRTSNLLTWLSVTLPTLASSVLAKCPLRDVLNIIPKMIGHVKKMKYFLHSYFLLLGTIFVPRTLVNCQKVTKAYTSYLPSPACNPSDYMRYPKTADEVVAIVNEAIATGKKVKAFGTRHSQTDIICTDGIPVDMKNINFAKMNADGTATFGAGILLNEAGKFLLQHGRAFRLTPAFSGLTLGGAVGTGAHGSSLKYSATLSEQVVGVTVVDGHGVKRIISDPEDLKSFRVHLGLLGIIVDITFVTVPLYKVLAHNYAVPDDVLTNGVALNWAKTTDHINFYWFPSFKEVIVANLTFVPVGTPGEAFTNAISPTSYGYFNTIGTKVKEIAYDLTSSDCALASALGNTVAHVIELITRYSLTTQTLGTLPIYSEDRVFIYNPAVGYPHSMLATICSEKPAGLLGTACFWAHGDLNANMTILDNEIAIATSDLSAFIMTVKDIIKKTPTAFPMQGLFIRFSAKSESYMSAAYGRDSAHIEFGVWKRTDFYNKASGSLAAYQTIMQSMAKKFNGRSHWGKSGAAYHTAEMLKLKLDENALENFKAAMSKFDPNQLFLNNFGRRLTQTGTKLDLDPKIIHCALLDNCFCSKNSDCATEQTCTTLPGYNFTVCKTKNEVPEAHFDKNSFPPPAALFNWLVTVLPTLVTSVLARCPLPGVLLKTVPNVVGSLLG
ncbi:L-gulonolactone oxidase 2 [Pseudolycoriella hygida]|uniref:L-gulonolactone oxidase 2 n=1 Tax=Pseudolycoriella hygida TaxID=35572 RepID=A0A9Q0MNG7_9DIPT|nr:L-gulonolactone oxidase 2 [Pseudolycoriella hygida]